tara:strand:+ start:6806 stop:8158 length:1353 start_codon:yes stop_codon:yes gene_type:complete
MATFSVNDQVRRTVSDGDGSVSSFPFSFQINAVSDIKVYVDDELKTAGQHYNVVNSSNVAGLNADGTGKVNFITSPTNYTPAANTRVSVVSDVPIARTSVYSSGGNITAASLESDFDTLTMIAGDNEETLSRSVHGPVSDPTTTSMQLPAKDTRKNKYLAFDNDGSVTCLPGTLEPLNTVDTAQLVDDAVTTAKVADNAITAAVIGTGAVTSQKIAADAVTQAAIADDAVGTDQIADGAVTAAKLATGAAFVSGMVMPYAGTSAPTGWLLAYGQSLSKTANSNEYANLFSAIGYTYGGSGDNFNLPDLRGRVAAGKDDMGGSAASRITSSQSNSDDAITGATLGDTGGDEVQDLQETHLPAHTHAVNSVTVQGLNEGTGSGVLSGTDLLRKGSGSVASLSITATTGASFTNANTGSTTSANHTASLANTGDGTAVNNMQPTIILNYIIKT